jgi:hypothetical protein
VTASWRAVADADLLCRYGLPLHLEHAPGCRGHEQRLEYPRPVVTGITSWITRK